MASQVTNQFSIINSQSAIIDRNMFCFMLPPLDFCVIPSLDLCFALPLLQFGFMFLLCVIVLLFYYTSLVLCFTIHLLYFCFVFFLTFYASSIGLCFTLPPLDFCFMALGATMRCEFLGRLQVAIPGGAMVFQVGRWFVAGDARRGRVWRFSMLRGAM